MSKQTENFQSLIERALSTHETKPHFYEMQVLGAVGCSTPEMPDGEGNVGCMTHGVLRVIASPPSRDDTSLA